MAVSAKQIKVVSVFSLLIRVFWAFLVGIQLLDCNWAFLVGIQLLDCNRKLLYRTNPSTLMK